MLQVDQYPVPRVEDLYATLAGGRKVGLLSAYQHILLDPESRKGLYQCSRLRFGVAFTPAVFQQTMEKVLQGLLKVAVYTDDILVTGSTDQEVYD